MEKAEVSDKPDYAKFFSRSHDAVIRVYDDAGNVIETHEYAGTFKRVASFAKQRGWSLGSGPKMGLAILQRIGANCLYVARNRLQNAV